jgi:hypothetical protein
VTDQASPVPPLETSLLTRLRAKWREELTDEQRRALKYWLPIAVAIGAVELLGALSGAFRNAIPWPTISSTIGHLEEGASWVGVVVVAAIAMAAYQATRGEPQERGGGEDGVDEAPIEKFERQTPVIPFHHGWPSVLLATGLVALVVHFVNDAKYALGYAIYGSFLVLGILIPIAFLRRTGKTTGFPSLLVGLKGLSKFVPGTYMLVIAGLAILVLHLALYPWPDLTRESASYAGLKAGQVRNRATVAVKGLRKELPQLTYSAQTRGISEGHQAWLVYFGPASGSEALPYSGCVVVVTDTRTEPSPECST